MGEPQDTGGRTGTARGSGPGPAGGGPPQTGSWAGGPPEARASETAGSSRTGVPGAEAGLTTGALARRLGVSPTTLRSWDRRYGIGTTVRTDGRHRRWTPDDVAMLTTMCRLTSSGVPPAEAARAAQQTARAAKGAPADEPPPPAPPSSAPEPAPDPGPAPVAGRSHAAGALPLGDVRQECRGLARAAVRLDAVAVEEQLTGAVREYGVDVAWQDVMVPTLHAVGRKWASSGDRYVEVEHLLSWHVSTVLRRSTRALTPAGGTGPGPVVLACVPGEQHTLPLEALNAALSQLGVPTRMFGAAVPVEALTASVRRLGPAAVVLWAQSRSAASLPLAQHIAATEWGVKGARRQPLVALGGPGWAGRPLRGMVRPGSLRDALDTLARAYGGGGVPA
ncbi:MerR family transcriptional regulator [Streptomyces sp. J2-1]|uniref:MerR family transcriptional regulator n=1 Tax=Streptomyces corallincola TaxID=2851888 RepID=UPI001C38EF7E|nr:MerR family transcriptional regulator [Streptomyces corallincola]MBV2352993.1 MerR family transcriptional regulator [Streptomyces corallincola]